MLLVVCTANRCRSPMAAGLLRRRLRELGIDEVVSSAGVRAVAGMPPTDEAIAAVGALGVDIAGHESRAIDGEDIERADFVLTMAREHVREVAVRFPNAWPKTFTLREIVRRADESGPRDEKHGETMPAWLSRAGALRSTSALLDSSRSDDVEDPIGRSARFYAYTAATLDDLVTRFVRAAWPARITDLSR